MFSQNASTPILPQVPTPYEYALLSTAIYEDKWGQQKPTSMTEVQQQYLNSKGWKLVEFISLPNAYVGGIWVNDNTQQIVIAHCGSQNATSWVTDIESVVRLKSGSFVKSAIEILAHPLVKECQKKGYRLSITGHSLGGFLAQVSVYWSHRAEEPET